MEGRRPPRGRGERDREVIPPVGVEEPATHPVNASDRHTEVSPPVGPRVRWSGVMSGFVVAMGTILLLTALGLAIGITTLGDPRASTDVIVQLLKTGITLRLATADRFREAETERVHHATRPHAQR